MATCKLTKKQVVELDLLISAYETARSALEEFLSDRQAEWEEQIESRSDKWKEGDAGQEAQERLDTLTVAHDEMPDVFNLDAENLG